MRNLGDALSRLQEALWEPFEPYVMKLFDWVKKVSVNAYYSYEIGDSHPRGGGA